MRLEFFSALQQNLSRVGSFYTKIYQNVSTVRAALHSRYGEREGFPEELDYYEGEDLFGALLELRTIMSQLEWYGEVNRRGFQRIFTKMAKIDQLNSMSSSQAEAADATPFANRRKLAQDVEPVDRSIKALIKAKVLDEANLLSPSRGLSGDIASNLSATLLAKADQAIRNDDASIMAEVIVEAGAQRRGTEDENFQRLLLELLHRSISYKSRANIEVLLSRVTSLQDLHSPIQDNCIHRLIVSIGRSKVLNAQRVKQSLANGALEISPGVTPGSSPNLSPWPSKSRERHRDVKTMDLESSSLLDFFLDKLCEDQRSSIREKDALGRTPLHHAAHYGLTEICKELVRRMGEWGYHDLSQGFDHSALRDSEGLSPLHLSVIGGHAETTKALLEVGKTYDQTPLGSRARISDSTSVNPTTLAVIADHVNIVQMLLESSSDVNQRGEHGETALHFAARLGRVDCARILSDAISSRKANIDVKEEHSGWTPLFMAAAEGHLAIVEHLLAAGADSKVLDLQGWTAVEHAALRGHLVVARKLSDGGTAAHNFVAGARDANSSLKSSGEAYNDARSIGSAKKAIKTATFPSSERPLSDHSMILVNLGSMDTRRDIGSVSLDPETLADAKGPAFESAYSVVVSARGATGHPTVIDLPALEDLRTNPIAFTTSDVTKVKLLFDIVPTNARNSGSAIGRGVALLGSIKPGVGANKSSLEGYLSVPILAFNSLEVIGSVNFNFLVINPFSHPNLAAMTVDDYWKSTGPTRIVGHRGTYE